MLGQTLETRAPVTTSAIHWTVIAAAMLVAAAALANFHIFMLGLAPLWLALALLLKRPTSQSLVLEENQILSLGTQLSVEYAAIRSVAIGDKSPEIGSPDLTPGPIRILHDQGQILLPESTNLPSMEVYRFLVSRIPSRPEREVNPSLAEHASEQTAKFGTEKVVVIHQRDPSIKFHDRAKLNILGRVMVFSGLIWLLIMILYELNAEVPESHVAWLGVGVFCLLLGALFWLLASVQPSKKRKHRAKYGRACIVVTPAGFAMDQGDLVGKLRWDEITGIKNASDGKWKGSREGPLHVSVAGGEVVILDLYEKSLVEIASLIMRNTGRLVG
jgi:hypothetical protein